MKVDVSEVGARPTILTPARMNAPQGARVLADVIHDLDFADYCLLVLDWEKNVLAVVATKRYPDIRRRADIDFIVDMDDAFTKDNFGLEVAKNIVDHLREEFEKKDAEAKAMEGRA